MNQWLNGLPRLARAVVLLWGMVFSLSAIAHGTCPQGRFPASGQTTPYQADINDGVMGNPVDVPDDGTVEAGATLRYRDHGNGTITDKNTGLMWEKKSDDGGLHDKDNAYPWSGGETIWDWLDDVNAEGGTGFAGYSDWRIPNVKELQSIIDYGRFDPAVDLVFNNNCTPGVDVLSGSCTASNYWSSTTEADSAAHAWNVGFSFGVVRADGKADFIILHVRAVRGGCL